MNEVVGAVTVTRLGSPAPDRTTAADDDWFERVSAAAAVGTSRSSIVDRDDDGLVDFDEFFDLATRSAQFVDADATRE